MGESPRRIRPNYFLLILFLLGAQWGISAIHRSTTALATAPKPPLETIPLTLSEWQGQGKELDLLSLEMLRPDAYLVRDYESAEGWSVNFTLLYGHGKSNFHSPALCLLGSGWNIIRKGKVSTMVGEGEGVRLGMTRLLIAKGARRSIVLYSFLTPGKSTGSWNLFQARLLSARLLGKHPRGASLRLIVPVRENEQATDAAAREFLRRIYPDLCQALEM
ncbi:MAG: EpsI family protein [Armatimonadetes bacterium]|nr:EpsI family protein [Armatimonadota bacterium]NIM22918.1 EpsI family protein [Armatimonadota bacterium]NIM66790.1 EpsI family protein [Armatimonadota bacterium]NIM75332.1 EpsI family protein [Armatimonadota bacterium]NIN04978.1 EpsI family protein [Armatimonadota bacterium]